MPPKLCGFGELLQDKVAGNAAFGCAMRACIVIALYLFALNTIE